MTEQAAPETVVEGPDAEQLQAVMRVAAATRQAADTEGTTEEKTGAVEDAIRETAKAEFPEMSDKQLQQLAEKLAPIVVALSVGPLTDSLIEQLQELDVVFTPGQAPPAESGTPEAAAQAEAAAEPLAIAPTEPPRKVSLAERFKGGH